MLPQRTGLLFSVLMTLVALSNCVNVAHDPNDPVPHRDEQLYDNLAQVSKAVDPLIRKALSVPEPNLKANIYKQKMLAADIA